MLTSGHLFAVRCEIFATRLSRYLKTNCCIMQKVRKTRSVIARVQLWRFFYAVVVVSFKYEITLRTDFYKGTGTLLNSLADVLIAPIFGLLDHFGGDISRRCRLSVPPRPKECVFLIFAIGHKSWTYAFIIALLIKPRPICIKRCLFI